MQKATRFKLMRKLVMLAVLCGCLGWLSASDTFVQPAAASPCCSYCEAYDQECYELYAEDPEGLQTCLQSIQNLCWSWCDFDC